jgi:nucleotide-binding universal stress UspA family protein
MRWPQAGIRDPVIGRGDEHTQLRKVGSPFHGDEEDRIQPQGSGGVVADREDARAGRGAERCRVVVGVNGSVASRAALRWAVHHAERTGSAVHAVAVWQPPASVGPDGRGPVPDHGPDEASDGQAREWLGEALVGLANGGRAASGFRARVHGHTEEGDPAEVLLSYARDAELLVLGNDGRGAVAEAVLGSVSSTCTRRARCPVVLVPHPAAVDCPAVQRR